MKVMKEVATIALYVVLGAVVMMALVMGALWLYGQPQEIRNTAALVLTCVDVLALAVIFGADYIKRRKRR